METEAVFIRTLALRRRAAGKVETEATRSMRLRWAFLTLLLWAGTAPWARSQTLTTICVFGPQCPVGQQTVAGLVQGSDGNFYGTAILGGSGQVGGTVFRITPSGAGTLLYNFCSQGGGCTDGSYPYAGLVRGSDGNFYGTTGYGGANGAGTVFKITPSGTLTRLYSFCSLPTNAQGGCADGQNPYTAALIQGSDGNFYGTTQYGGDFGSLNTGGTVFKITPDGQLTTLYSFCSQSDCTDGSNPAAALVQASDGNFYGTTLNGGSPNTNSGTVFKITSAGTLTTLYTFCEQIPCTDGQSPMASLVMGTDGNLYGETYNGGGGTSSGGTVFKLTPNPDGTWTESVLYSFCAQTGCPDGAQPSGGLALGTDGSFYGTTYYGGSDNVGTLFQITPGGSLTPLPPFAGPNGAYPFGKLLLASDGTFYGTTQGGGSQSGTVFRLSPTLTLSPPSLDFGNQPVTITSPPQSVTLTNSGATPLEISSITPSGDFAETNTCPLSPSTLAAGANCTISVNFTPTATGARAGAITITDNAANSSQSLPLSGNGTDFSVSASPTARTVKAGKSTTYTLGVAPVSGFTGTVALSCSGAPPAGTCSVSPTSVTLNGINASSATVTATTAMGKKGTPKGTYTLTLTGRFSTLSRSTKVTLTVQ